MDEYFTEEVTRMPVPTSIKAVAGVKGEPRNIVMVDPRELEVWEDNPRKDDSLNSEEDKAFAQSLLEGTTPPPTILVAPILGNGKKKFAIIDGKRQYSALMRAYGNGLPIKPIPVQVTQETDLNKLLVMSLVRNEGKHLTPLEEADAYAKMLARGMSVVEVANAVHKTKGHVSKMWAIARAPETVRKAVAKGMSINEAVAIVSAAEKEAKGLESEEAEQVVTEKADAAVAQVMKAKEVKRSAKVREKAGLQQLVEEHGIVLTKEEKAQIRILEKHHIDGWLSIADRALFHKIKLLTSKNTTEHEKKQATMFRSIKGDLKKLIEGWHQVQMS